MRARRGESSRLDQQRPTGQAVLRFDFRLHDGPSSTRNAISLLDALPYPAALVADARAAVDWQRPRAEASGDVTAAGG